MTKLKLFSNVASKSVFIILGLTLIALGSFHLYKNTATTSTNGLSTYTSSVGGFSFKYPSTWNVNATDDGASQTELMINSATAQTSTTNALRLILWVSNDPDASYQPAVIPNGTVQKLSNGINLWISNSTHSSRPTSTGSIDCPVVEIVNSSLTHFSYTLPNGQYLTLQGSFCLGERDTPSTNYQNQLSSQDWQAASSIISSITFN